MEKSKTIKKSKNLIRQEAILTYLKEKKQTTREELIQQFNTSSATLCADLATLKKNGHHIETPARSGLVIYTETVKKGDSLSLIQPLKQTMLRQFFLIQFLSAGEMTLVQLADKYVVQCMNVDEIWVSPCRYKFNTSKETELRMKFYNKMYHPETVPFSIHVLRQDLKRLQDRGIVEMLPPVANSKEYRYALTKDFPPLLQKNYSQLQDFVTDYQLQGHASPWKQLDTVYQKFLALTDVKPLSDMEQRYFYSRGKTSDISPDLRRKLDVFQKLPYQTKVLEIPYLTNAGETITLKFKTGLIVYSHEKNQLYVLGETEEFLYNLRMTNIDVDNIQYHCLENNVFKSSKYIRIFHEMFSISVDEPVDVVVRFKNFGNMLEKLKALQKNRQQTCQALDVSSIPGEIIYRDTVRGLNDFARYLRSFGRAALAVEPPELLELMMETPRKVIEAYEQSGVLENSNFK